MHLLRRIDYETRVAALPWPFVGHGEESDTAVLELTHNWDQKEPYAIGTGFGHLAIGVVDIYAACDALRAAGVKITREPGPDEARLDGDRICRRSGWLQSRIDRAELSLPATAGPSGRHFFLRGPKRAQPRRAERSDCGYASLTASVQRWRTRR